ncbi:MAG: Cytochrome c [Planctomycetaceae bacterium]|nr:Cytochrome c [Planctomycetaceae bacterium]
MRLRCLFVGLSLFLASVSWAAAEEFPEIYDSEKSKEKPMTPDEVVKTAKLPPGFELSVFAAEPAVQNPIAITTDERGRLWVAENFTWAGSGLGNYDVKLRDRIVILEDTDGDGKHDKRTVFWDGAVKLTSVEVGFGGVWAICLPNLLFIPDRNRDDIPDGPPVVVLDGINDHSVGHTPANGLKWGPDGWLYARHGILATSSIGAPGASESQRFKINTGVWRYHPTRQKAEAVMHGMTNSWGTDWTSEGEMFVINTVIGHLWHVVPGAHTQRMFGADINPYAYKLIAQVAGHVHWDTGEAWNDIRKGVTDKTSAAGGGHAHIGMMIYQGDNWPEEYRGRVYTLNLHGRRINSDILVREGAGYTAKRGPDMCFIADPFFRGMDLISGADGGVYIADWSDTGECHDHDGVHRTSGRIYKLTYGKPKPLAPFDLSKERDVSLAEMQLAKNDWYSRQARRLLQERVAAAEQAGKHNERPEKPIWDAPTKLHGFYRFVDAEPGTNAENSIRRLRAFWALNAVSLNAVSKRDSDWLIRQLEHPDEHVRVWAVRFLADQMDGQKSPSPAVLTALQKVATKDQSGLVLLYVASALQQLPLEARWPIATALAAQKSFATDRMFPNMLWLGIEPAIPRDPAKSVELLKTSQVPMLRENIARRLAEEIEKSPVGANALLKIAEKASPEVQRDILVGMSLGLKGWRKATQPEAWKAVSAKTLASSNAEIQTATKELGVVFGDGLAIEALQALVKDGGADPAARGQAIRELAQAKLAGAAPLLQGLLRDRAVAIEAVRGLAQYDAADTPQKLLEVLGGFSPEARGEVVNTLISRPAYAKVLLKALRDKQVLPSEISAYHARQILSFEDKDLTKQLTELWGDVRTTPTEKKEMIERFKAELNSATLAKADLGAGRSVYQKTCANCHVLYGAGRKVGPDLTGSNRKNLDYLLENVIDPSAVVGADFRVLVVTLQDGRVLSGVVSEQNERTITLQLAQAPITIDRKEIEESKQTTSSLMPDGQMQTLTKEQIRDLMAYLMSTDQVPLPTE